MHIPGRVRAGILILAVLLILVFIAIPWMVNENRIRTGHHVTGYDIRISSDSDLKNLTLFLPVPSADGSYSHHGEEIARGLGYNVPAGWNLSVVYAEGSPMLKVSGPGLVPERTGYPVPTHEETGQIGTQLYPAPEVKPIPLATMTIIRADEENAVRISPGGITRAPVIRPVTFGIRKTVNQWIDTRNPVGAEQLLYPKGPVSSVSCKSPYSETSRCYTYPSRIYVNYSSNENPDIDVTITLTGINEWWEMGWTTNSYTDRISTSPLRGQQGWITAEGDLRTGNGRY